MNLIVYANLIEEFPVSQRPIEFPLQNRTKIYGSFRSIVELHAQGI
jgi:hypothetical protein